jgi:hypothetical protein
MEYLLIYFLKTKQISEGKKIIKGSEVFIDTNDPNTFIFGILFMHT